MNANRVWQSRAPSTVTLLDRVFFLRVFFIFFCSFSCREHPQENFEPHRVVVVRLIPLSYAQQKELHAGVCHLTITMRVLITNAFRHLNAGIRLQFCWQQKETQIGVFTSVPQREQLLSQELMRFLFAFFSMLINVFSPSAGNSQHVCCLIFFFCQPYAHFLSWAQKTTGRWNSSGGVAILSTAWSLDSACSALKVQSLIKGPS